MALTQEQLSFFKHNGYLIVRGALDQTGCAKARDLLWDSLPANTTVVRDDPTTHVGPFVQTDRNLDSKNVRDGYRWQVRHIGTHTHLIELVFSEPMQAIAQCLLGAQSLRPPRIDGSVMGTQGAAWPDGPVDPALDNDGVRGIYCTLPYGAKAREPDSAHTDGHPFNFGVVGFINDVPPDGGGFKVWPGSHRRLYPTFAMRYDQPRIPYYAHLPSHKGIMHSQSYLAELSRLQADTHAVDCHGRCGDVVFWHHRLAHMAGHNYTDVIRQAVLYDFCKTDLDQRRMDPAQGDMWWDWSDALQAAGTEYSAQFAAEQNLHQQIS